MHLQQGQHAFNFEDICIQGILKVISGIFSCMICDEVILVEDVLQTNHPFQKIFRETAGNL